MRMVAGGSGTGVFRSNAWTSHSFLSDPPDESSSLEELAFRPSKPTFRKRFPEIEFRPAIPLVGSFETRLAPLSPSFHCRRVAFSPTSPG